MTRARPGRRMRPLAAAIALLPFAAAAQDVAQTNSRHDEDWSVLQERPREGWRGVKYIPLAEDGRTYLTLGGETRLRFEGFAGNFWGDPPAPDDGYLWFRAMPHADVHAGPARVFVQGIAGYARGVGAGEGPVDETGIDLLQGFVDLRLDLGRRTSLTFRGGREVIALGSERLVNVRYGPNIPLSFDGFRAIAGHGPLRVDVFRMRPVRIGAGHFDDAASTTQRLDGIYATVAAGEGVGFDAYWLGYGNEAARFAGRIGHETRDTFGVRLFGKHGDIGWNWEAMVQRGDFDGDRIRAWSLSTETRWRFPDAPFKPHLRMRANIASGDRNPADKSLGTFNALFPKAKYFGELTPVGPRNIVNIHPSVELDLGRDVVVEFAAARFWRQSRSDGVYDIPGGLIRPAGDSRVRHIGNLTEVSASWQASPILSFSASLSAFRAGAFIRETGRARTIRMIGTEALLKF